MKRRATIFAMLLITPLSAFASKPDPADYKLNAHVRSTELTYACNSSFMGGATSCGMRLLVVAVIDGKKLELRANTSDLLRTGDYKAKEKVDDFAAEKKIPSYVDQRVYDFLLPDGKIMTFQVVGEADE